MLIELTDSVKKLFLDTASQLKGAARRRFQAEVVMELGYGGQLLAQKELGWDRNTIRKEIKELTTGITCVDNYSLKGRWKAEEHLLTLLEDIKKLVDSQSQTDPSFKSQRLYTRLTASEVRKLLIDKFGYSNDQLPTEETICVKLNYLGYRLKRGLINRIFGRAMPTADYAYARHLKASFILASKFSTKVNLVLTISAGFQHNY